VASPGYPMPPLRPYSLSPGQLIEVEAVQPEIRLTRGSVVRACRRAGVTPRRAGDRVGAENHVASRDLHVLMYEAAESVSSERLDGCSRERGTGACGRVLMQRSVRTVRVVKSVRGAVPVFRPARFPGPLPEPAVRLSPQRALRKSQVGLPVTMRWPARVSGWLRPGSGSGWCRPWWG
jgi:hypothetical protein